MLGRKERRFAPLVKVSVEDLVPVDQFDRPLDAGLDRSFVREWVQDKDAPRGRPASDPVVFFRLQLAMVFEGLRAARPRMRLAADRLSVRWSRGDALDAPLPDHASRSRIRERSGAALFRRCCEAIVARCQAAGLVWGQAR